MYVTRGIEKTVLGSTDKGEIKEEVCKTFQMATAKSVLIELQSQLWLSFLIAHPCASAAHKRQMDITELTGHTCSVCFV